MPVYIYSAIKIADLYPCGKNIYQLDYSVYVQFLLPLVLRTPVISTVI